MKKYLIILLVFLAFLLIPASSAYRYYYDYYEAPVVSSNFIYYYYPNSGTAEFYFSIKDIEHCYYHKYCYPENYWVEEGFDWRRDPVARWINKGETFRERAKRARAVNFLIDSWVSRYEISSGKTSEEAFSYNSNAEDAPAQDSTNFRYKEAYSPRIHGIDRKYDYYYKPSLDKKTQTYNWRY